MHNEDLEGGSYVSILAGKVIPHRQGRCARGGARVRLGVGLEGAGTGRCGVCCTVETSEVWVM